MIECDAAAECYGEGKVCVRKERSEEERGRTGEWV